MRKGAIYARYSSDNQREESIDAQIRAIMEYAARNRINIVATYKDEAMSATTADRPEFLRMIEDSGKDIFDVIIVHKLDRFSRNRYDSAIYKRKLQINGVNLISVLENLDDSPESIILESVLEGMSEYYSANLSREVMKGMNETALQCKHTGGRPPLGYDVADDQTYLVNEKEARAIDIIFNMYANGYGYRAIATKLNNEGYRTQLGRKFSKNSFHDILKNEKYIGTFTFNRTASAIHGVRNHRKSKEDSEIVRIEDGMPRLVSNSTWRKVRERMNNNIKGTGRSKEVYLLSGKIKCGECGGSFVGNRRRAGRNKDWYVTYECSTRKRTKECDAKSIRKDFVEEVVIDNLLNTLFLDESIESVIEHFREVDSNFESQINEDLKYYTNRLTTVDNSINNIIKQIENGMFHESMNNRLGELESEKAIIETNIKEIKYDKAHGLPSEDKIREELQQYKNIKKLGLNNQKMIIQTFINSVIVNHDSIEVNKIVDFNGGGGGS